ncbi:MAG: hypothetical protein WCG00_18845, partial [Hyphomicrobiales bacterium]
VRHARDPVNFHGDLWSGNFYPALRTLGHEIVESQVDLSPVSRFMHVGHGFTPQELEARARTTQAILDEVIDAHRRQPSGYARARADHTWARRMALLFDRIGLRPA